MGSSSPPCMICAATGRPGREGISVAKALCSFSCLFLALLCLPLLAAGLLSCRAGRSAGGLGGALATRRLALGSELPLRMALGSARLSPASGLGARLELDLPDPSISERASLWGVPERDTAPTGLLAWRLGAPT